MNYRMVSKNVVLVPFFLLAACSSEVTLGPEVQIGGLPSDTGGTSLTGGTVVVTGGTAPNTGGVTTETGGMVLTGGAIDTGGTVETGGTGETGGTVAIAGDCDSGEAKFSFFVTSLETMQTQSGSPDGFGGDFGGLAGADGICQTAAAHVGCGNKTWRAFLSVTDNGNGNPVDAIDRIGSGPWYDARGLLISQDTSGLINRGKSSGQGRPDGDANAVDDLADEFGQGLRTAFPDDDDHDIVTGTNQAGMLASTDGAATCNDWTSTTVSTGSGVQCGHAWSAGSGHNWIEVHTCKSCAAGVNLSFAGRGGDGSSIGAGGGWGGIYCFAL